VTFLISQIQGDFQQNKSLRRRPLGAFLAATFKKK